MDINGNREVRQDIQMKGLKQAHFYYGAILTAIMEYNPDASFVLLQPQDHTRKIYHIQTNASQECIIFLKHAFEKQLGSQSWSYTFSKDDKKCLAAYYKQKTPIFIYLLCAVDGLQNSEIAILKYDEFLKVSHKTNFTIGTKKNARNFNLHLTKSPKDDILIPRNRIEQTFDYLIADTIKQSNGYYCPQCGTHITIGR